LWRILRDSKEDKPRKFHSYHHRKVWKKIKANIQLGKKVKTELPEKRWFPLDNEEQERRQQGGGKVGRFWIAGSSPRCNCLSQNHFFLSNHGLCCRFLVKQPIFSPKLSGKLVEMKRLLFITTSSRLYSYLIHSGDFS